VDFTVASYAVWRAGVAAGTAATAVADETSATPNVSFIPPLERRRLTGVERAALAVAWQVRPEGEVPVVFASRWGEIGVTVKLMTQFHAEREMSPAGFSASVHNAAPRAFSLLTHNQAPYTAIAARERSLEAGLLEALTQEAAIAGRAAVAGRPPYRGAVVFVFAEEATPAFYAPAFGPLQGACAFAVRLEPGRGATCCARTNGLFRAEFRAMECAPVSFDAADAFFSGRAGALEAASFTLSRG
jgi:hypothetical protein